MQSADTLEFEGVSLVNRGLALWNEGRREDAVRTMRQGIAVCRTLASADPAKVDLLATGLSNLGAMLQEWGRAAEAVPILEHSIKIRRVYGDRSPEFTADLAGSLKNLGSALYDSGSPADAIATMTESIDTYRGLVEQGRTEYEYGLALALNGRGNAQGLVGGALDDFTEAAARLRKQDLDDFDQGATLLAAVLASRCGVLLDRGEHDQAVTDSAEAVSIFRRLGAANPTGIEPYLGKALATQAQALVDAGRPGDAHASAMESVEIVRRCYVANPDGWRTQLISSLRLLTTVLPALGRQAEADAAAEEIDRLVDEDARDDKPLHRPGKGSLLSRLRRRRKD